MSDITVDAIKRAVCLEFGIGMMDLMSQRKAREFSHPRQVAIYLASRLTAHSYPALGRFFAGRDHSTIKAAIRRIQAKMEENPLVALGVTALEDRIREPELVEQF